MLRSKQEAHEQTTSPDEPLTTQSTIPTALFDINKGGVDIFRVTPNEDIYIRGVLTTDDSEIVRGLLSALRELRRLTREDIAEELKMIADMAAGHADETLMETDIFADEEVLGGVEHIVTQAAALLKKLKAQWPEHA